MCERQVALADLRPNNWYINGAKLEAVRRVWERGEQERLPPVLVTQIDGELSLIDGHSRALAALENGAETIRAAVRPLEEIEGSRALYEHIHRAGPGRGVRGIADLSARVLDSQEHCRRWVGYCRQWLAENGEDE